MRLKRSGQELDIATHLPNKSTSVAVTCPACPQPGFNMPEDWREKQTPQTVCVLFKASIRVADLRRSHANALFLGIDGNFRAVLKRKRHDREDVPLLDGRSYFVPSEKYLEYERTAPTDPDEVRSGAAYLPCTTLTTSSTSRLARIYVA